MFILYGIRKFVVVKSVELKPSRNSPWRL